LALDNLINFKSCRAKVAGHFIRAEEKEINTDFLIPPLIQMNGVVANMKCQQQDPARSQDSEELAKSPRHVIARHVDDGVEGRDSRPCIVRRVQRHHVALLELDARIQATRSLYQRGR